MHAKLGPQALFRQVEQDVIFGIPSVLKDLEADLLDLSLVQARARAESIELVPVDLAMDQALRIASVYRRDWMNARASLVNSWRSIYFVANNLRGFLNLVFDGDISTSGNNPVKFQSPTGTLRVGVQFDAPFTRLLERNTYREALIDYQRAKRNYYQFIDRISESLRSTIRTIELNQLSFEKSAVFNWS